MNRILWLKL